MRRFVLLTSVTLAIGCGAEGIDPAEHRGSLVGGARTAGDPAVVAHIAEANTSRRTTRYCTGTVIAPTVVLTAAHCAASELVERTLRTSDYKEWIFLGDNWDDRSQRTDENLITIKERHINPGYDPARVDDATQKNAGMDIALLVTERPIPVTPIPLHRMPVDRSWVGRKIRELGYGTMSATSTDGLGQKRVGELSVVEVDDRFIWANDPQRSACEGDSGGPFFAMVEGVETLIGVFVINRTPADGRSEPCSGTSYSLATRVDKYAAAFIDPILAANPSSPIDSIDGGAAGDGGGGDGSGGGCTLGPRRSLHPGSLAALLLLLLFRRIRR